MCQYYTRLSFLFIFLITFGCFTSQAQNLNRLKGENSPYSRYGIGDFRNGVNVALRGMASASTAASNEYYINTDNPASYAKLKFTTYEAAGEGSSKTIVANDNSISTGSASLSYLSIGIPLGKYAGMAIGLRPNTRVYYRMNDTTDLPDIGSSIRAYYGEGGTNYAFIGAGGQYKGFSIGFNLGYMFGTIRNTSVVQRLEDTVRAMNADFSRYTKIGGLHWKLGAQYETKLNDKLGLRIGATTTLGQTLNAWRDEFGLIWRISGGSTVADTAIDIREREGKIQLPLSYSAGVQIFGTDQWTVGLDFSAAQWEQFRSYDEVDSLASSTYRIALGGEYTPNATSMYNYFQRVTYRLGVYYGKDYVRLRETDLPYFAVTAGASFPYRRSPDRLHVALELGRRGTEDNGLIRENFFRFALGISLNDRWFVKRRYD